MIFKQGDDVRLKCELNWNNYIFPSGIKGRIGIITKYTNEISFTIFVVFDVKDIKNNEYLSQQKDIQIVVLESQLELLDNKKNMINIKEKFALALTKEPMKSFRKVGITNGDDLLTDDGQKVFLSWLLNKKFAEDFKSEVVVDMLKDLEDEK